MLSNISRVVLCNRGTLRTRTRVWNRTCFLGNGGSVAVVVVAAAAAAAASGGGGVLVLLC
jgi:hypothetical protein